MVFEKVRQRSPLVTPLAVFDPDFRAEALVTDKSEDRIMVLRRTLDNEAERPERFDVSWQHTHRRAGGFRIETDDLYQDIPILPVSSERCQ
jgi:hypothetical protein